jgi:hypothetical protein
VVLHAPRHINSNEKTVAPRSVISYQLSLLDVALRGRLNRPTPNKSLGFDMNGVKSVTSTWLPVPARKLFYYILMKTHSNLNIVRFMG